MTQDDPVKVGHPLQRQSFDLSQDPRELRRDGKKAPDLVHGTLADRRDPQVMMAQMGFEPTKYMNPLQFLLAVMNDDTAKLFKDEKRRARIEAKGGLGISYRIEAAKTAAKYLHQEQPKQASDDTNDQGFGAALAEAIAAGSERVRTREIIIREVERIAPPTPLQPASYPPAFDPSHADAIDADCDDVTAEGDTDYNPDDDDDFDDDE